jgi:hypothetical protein
MKTLIDSSPQADMSLYIYERNSPTGYEYDVAVNGI